jgi:hypothetical protein
MSGRKLVLLVVLGAAAIAALRLLCVPVGSFREGLAGLSWGMPADSVREALGDPNFVCTDPAVAHLKISVSPDTATVRRALAGATVERWVYARARPTTPVTRDPDPVCRAPVMATELGFDGAGRLRWYVRETDQTPATIDPGVLTP